MTPDLPDGLLRYLAERDLRRAGRVEHTLAAMTVRERRLVREAAVMGYVQGVRAVPGGHNATIPPDSTILARVVGACLAFPDLYPVIGRIADGGSPVRGTPSDGDREHL